MSAIERAANLRSAAAAAVPPALLALFGTAKRIWVVPHERPDGDALGAALGLKAILAQKGAEVAVLCSEPPPKVYSVIPTIGDVRIDRPEWIPDAVVLVDCGDLTRAGSVGDAVGRLPRSVQRATIDHHVSNSSSSPLEWIDPSAAATCELVTLIGVALDADFTADNGKLATALAAGVIMDTATFQHGNTTPRTLEVAGLLLAAGAPLSEISRRLYRTKPYSQVQLHARVIGRSERADGGSTVWTAMLRSDLADAGATAEESEGIVDALAQIDDSDVALFFKEESAGETRVSIRTKEGALDATTIASALSGGGHARAAGATISEPLDRSIKAVLERVASLRAGRRAIR